MKDPVIESEPLRLTIRCPHLEQERVWAGKGPRNAQAKETLSEAASFKTGPAFKSATLMA